MTKIKPGKKFKNSDQPCQAELADKFVCYQQSVQEPDHEIEVFDQIYREAFKSKALTLREDFCGTFAVFASLRFQCALKDDRHPFNHHLSGDHPFIRAQSNRQDAKAAKATRRPSQEKTRPRVV